MNYSIGIDIDSFEVFDTPDEDVIMIRSLYAKTKEFIPEEDWDECLVYIDKKEYFKIVNEYNSNKHLSSGTVFVNSYMYLNEEVFIYIEDNDEEVPVLLKSFKGFDLKLHYE